ncbi:MAG: FAD-dependent oxidoreductase [Acidimicrobiia bacterium]|nr:FAD-dependent oxidoreductase [Acidimicrobiia bacterium]
MSRVRRPFSRSAFDRVLAPGRIGPIELPNRVILPAMDMNLCDAGEITDAEIAHYTTRAAGGAGMLISGSGAVGFPIGAASHLQPGLSDDKFIGGLSRLADAVHAAGSVLCIQLCHHGKTARVDIEEARELLVPSMPEGAQDMSALVDNTGDEIGKLAATTAGRMPTFAEATEDDMAQVTDWFAEAAGRVREAGADGVELHAAHGYLLSTFLSRADNRRTDRWGGSIENRARLITDCTAAVREVVGDDLAVVVRVSGREYGGDAALTVGETVAAARLIEAAGADAIHVTGYGRNSFANFTDGPLPDTIGAYREDAAAVKEAVDIPVIAVGRILPELAEEMLTAGDCDFVSMGRQLLADPDLVNKLRARRREAIRPCINCYVCVEQNFFDDPPVCAVNPELGRTERADFTPVQLARHVVVIGGGPAGMEAARIARIRGHRVTLLEASDRLGGTVWFSQLTTPANGPLIDWLTGELARLEVVVRLGVRADRAAVAALRPDAVVVATGASRGRPDVPGADLDHVVTGDQLRSMLMGEPTPAQPLWLRTALSAGRRLHVTTDAGRVRALSKRWMPVGSNVVVVGGGLVGLELSVFLAERGRNVTVLESGPELGLPMAMPRRWTAVRHARELGVTLVRSAVLTEITPAHVVHREGTGAGQTTIEADVVIVAGEVGPGGVLAEQLSNLDTEVHVIGDAVDVGYIQGAIHSAWDVALAL